jgi:hypothetical protein
MRVWEDISRWSHRDTAETKKTPKAWRACFGEFKLYVHHHNHYPPEVWLATCDGVFEQSEMTSIDIDEAKLQAMAKLQGILKEALDSF